MTHNVCYVDCHCGCSKDYAPGNWCSLVDPYGHDLCAVRIDEVGGMSVTKPAASIYRMGPYTPEGVTVYKDGQPIGVVYTVNDTEAGKFQVYWECAASSSARTSYTETISYDPLTGAIRKIEKSAN